MTDKEKLEVLEALSHYIVINMREDDDGEHSYCYHVIDVSKHQISPKDADILWRWECENWGKKHAQ